MGLHMNNDYKVTYHDARPTGTWVE